jgi:hypothetical protein
MKKLVLALSSLLLVMISCSSNNDETQTTPEDPSTILLKKELVTEDGVETTSNIIYNGNKLVSAVAVGGYKTIYTYTGDFITKIELFRPDETI